jgi:NAD(P)-dependent dehydrogenase (short-subunit alcohol dehydrogenase family)
MPAPVVIVTEGSRGIGRATAEALQSRGAAGGPTSPDFDTRRRNP